MVDWIVLLATAFGDSDAEDNDPDEDVQDNSDENHDVDGPDSMDERPVIADYFTNAGNIFFQTGTCSLLNIALSYIPMESPGKQCILLQGCLVISRYTYFT